MTDPLPPEQPDDPRPDGKKDLVSEGELDDALARASSLAEELAREVGADADAVARTPPAPPSSAEGDDVADADAALSELESLIESATRELDEDAQPTADDPAGDRSDFTAAESDPTAPSEPRSATPPGARYEVPDFLAEFTDGATAVSEPGAPAAAKNEAAVSISPKKTPAEPPPVRAPEEKPPHTVDQAETADPADPETERPGRVATGQFGVVSTPGFKSTPPRPKVPADEPADSIPAPPPEASLLQQWLHQAKWRLWRLLLQISERGVALLEQLDRPFAVLGDRARQIVGWAALATLGTSLIVYVCTLF